MATVAGRVDSKRIAVVLGLLGTAVAIVALTAPANAATPLISRSIGTSSVVVAPRSTITPTRPVTTTPAPAPVVVATPAPQPQPQPQPQPVVPSSPIVSRGPIALPVDPGTGPTQGPVINDPLVPLAPSVAPVASAPPPPPPAPNPPSNPVQGPIQGSPQGTQGSVGTTTLSASPPPPPPPNPPTAVASNSPPPPPPAPPPQQGTQSAGDPPPPPPPVAVASNSPSPPPPNNSGSSNPPPSNSGPGSSAGDPPPPPVPVAVASNSPPPPTNPPSNSGGSLNPPPSNSGSNSGSANSSSGGSPVTIASTPSSPSANPGPSGQPAPSSADSGQSASITLASNDPGNSGQFLRGSPSSGGSVGSAPAAGSQDLIVTATIPQTSDVSTGSFVFNSGGSSSPAQIVTAAPIVPQTVAATGLAGIVAPGASSNTQVTAAVAGNVVTPDGSQRVAIDLYGDKLLSFAVDPTTGKKIAASNGTLANSGTAAGDSVTMLASVAQEVVHAAVNLAGIHQANGFLMRDGRLVLVFVDNGGGQ